jgi:hypothetical protein
MQLGDQVRSKYGSTLAHSDWIPQTRRDYVPLSSGVEPGHDQSAPALVGTACPEVVVVGAVGFPIRLQAIIMSASGTL